MIVNKDYWLSDNDIKTCIEAGAISLFNIKDTSNLAFEDILVQSGAVSSKSFIRKNINAITVFVFKDKCVADLKLFAKTPFTFGKFDMTNCKSILVKVANNFTLINYESK